MAKRELAMECDYEYEARCQKRFKKLISSDPDLAESFNVPDIIDELSGKTVITSEWVPGVHIDKVSFAQGLIWSQKLIITHPHCGAMSKPAWRDNACVVHTKQIC